MNSLDELDVYVPLAVIEIVSSLEEEIERLRADAERYRWLRNDAPDTDPTAPIVCIVDEGFADMLNGTELDAAIDAAMKGGGND